MAKFMPEVDHYENRGDDEILYGFVYFKDGKRVGYAPGTHGTRAPYGLFDGGWGRVSEAHYFAAEQHLKAQGFEGKPYPIEDEES